VSLLEEIHEQPAVIRRLLDEGWGPTEDVARWSRDLDFDHVIVAARGTSDNAARYAQYLWGARNRLVVGLAAPSLFGPYEAPPRLGRALVVGISQSGQSPDLVAVLREGRRQGTPTLAITNDPESPLAEQADRVLPLLAGSERSVAATKTYTAELMTVAMLCAALAEDAGMRSELARVPAVVEDVLGSEGIGTVAAGFADIDRCAVLGRGYNHATAFEWALKLQELCAILAQPASTADFAHGPSAVVGAGFPVFAVAPEGPLREEAVRLLDRFVERDARILCISDRADCPPQAVVLTIPPGPEWASPIPAVVTAQLFTHHLTVAKGLDPEAPRGLSKVTRTR
jgi:glucosamine--fructose-6-phosphate aminotransferase (isomerizing)